MNRDQIQPSIGSGESYRRIREALRAEKDKRWGEIAEIEADLGVSNGYLAKVCRGEWNISIERLLLTLERMGIDSGRFFVNALEIRLGNDWLLEEIERLGETDGRLAHVEKVTAELETAAALGPEPPPIDGEAMVADFVRCDGKEQRRRLGGAQKYCHPAFAAAYLEHLDALRYDDARTARQNAEAVAVKLVPRLPGKRSERIALQLKAIGVYASCHRQKGDFATAARAFRLALTISRAHGLEPCTAELLQRAGYVLSDNGRYSAAMKLLDEALVICFSLDLQRNLGTLMVDRGSALYNLGKFQETVNVITKALRLLQGDSRRTKRNRVVANQTLTRAYKALGDLERAESALKQAVAESDQTGTMYRASLLWDHGVIALARSSYALAEDSLREATALFGRLNDRHKALVTLDLTEALIAQGKNLEAIAEALSMAEYLRAFRGNKVAEAAISDLIQTAVRGNLTLAAIERTQDALKSVNERSGAKPFG